MYNATCHRACDSGIVRRMAKGGFWDYQDYWKTVTSSRGWFDSEWKQRRDINDLEIVEAMTQDQVTSLQLALGQAQKQLLELSMTVVVMSELLAEAGALDTAKLHARIDAELEALRPKVPVGAKVVTCARCGQQVAETATTITERYGTVCDRCAEQP
jgi:hypothetical protein